MLTPATTNTLSNFEISESDILGSKRTRSPQSLWPRQHRHCSIALTAPLHHLFSMCIRQQNNWKIHQISPIHKSGDKSSIENYRPISLLSCTSKILERLIFNHTTDFLTNPIITNYQFGFLKNRRGALLFAIYITIYPSPHHYLQTTPNTLSLSDTAILQNDIKAIATWSELWNIPFNENKFIHLRFLPHLTPVPSPVYQHNHSFNQPPQISVSSSPVTSRSPVTTTTL